MSPKSKIVNHKFKRGFGMIELILAIFVLVVGALAVFGFVNTPLVETNNSMLKLTGAYLAQEGVELVRNIRDTNWIEQRADPSIDWDDGLGEGDYKKDNTFKKAYEADYSSELQTFDEGRLKFSGGYYRSSTDRDAPFTRKITITRDIAKKKKESDKDIPILIVNVTVDWSARGHSDSIEVEENLYEWWENQ